MCCNVIRQIVLYAGDKGQCNRLSTSGVDGQLVIWDLKVIFKHCLKYNFNVQHFDSTVFLFYSAFQTYESSFWPVILTYRHTEAFVFVYLFIVLVIWLKYNQSGWSISDTDITVYYFAPTEGGIKRWCCLTSVCVSVAYIYKWHLWKTGRS